jgi:hypothetical protein
MVLIFNTWLYNDSCMNPASTHAISLQSSGAISRNDKKRYICYHAAFSDML